MEGKIVQYNRYPCPECGEAIPRDAEYCYHCRKTVKISPPPDKTAVRIGALLFFAGIIFIIIGIFCHVYTTYTTVPASSFGGEIDIPLYPYRRYAVMFWILGAITFVSSIILLNKK